MATRFKVAEVLELLDVDFEDDDSEDDFEGYIYGDEDGDYDDDNDDNREQIDHTESMLNSHESVEVDHTELNDGYQSDEGMDLQDSNTDNSK